MSKMKALAKTKKDIGIEMIETEVPSPKFGEVKIKIKKTSICGTDIHIWNWDEWAKKTIPVPMVVGHEYVGYVDSIGEGVSTVKVGDRVSGEGHIVCGNCEQCRNETRHFCPNTKGVGVNRTGSFAEYLVIPELNVIKLPDSINDNLASILDPLGNAVHTALSFDLVGKDVIITGAGPIGAMSAAVCRFAGARNIVITDVNDYRLSLVKKLYDNIHTLNVKDHNLNDFTKKLGISGYHVGLEMSGNPLAFNDMLEVMSPGGSISLLAILPQNTKLNWDLIIFKGLFLKGIYGREMFKTWTQSMNMLEAGLNINPIITHEMEIDKFKEGFELMRSGQSGKIILNW